MKEDSTESFKVDILHNKFQPLSGILAQYCFCFLAICFVLGASKYGIKSTIGYKLGMPADMINYIAIVSIVLVVLVIFFSCLSLIKSVKGEIEFNEINLSIDFDDGKVKRPIAFSEVKKMNFSEGAFANLINRSKRRGQITIDTDGDTFYFDIQCTDIEKRNLNNLVSKF